MGKLLVLSFITFLLDLGTTPLLLSHLFLSPSHKYLATSTMSSCLSPRSMHDSRWIYWGNPTFADSKDDANVGSDVDDPRPKASWLSHCIPSRCLSLLYSCQQRHLLTRRHLTSPRQIHLSFASHLSQLVAALPHVAPPPHIHWLALPPAPASCCVSFVFAPAS
jgi:hypothetical protein